MIGAALEWALDFRMRGIDLSGQAGPEDAAVVADILRCFKLGAGGGLRGWDATRMRALEAEVPWTRRLFFWEGHALGACGRHACLFAGGNPHGNYHAPGYRFMFWTGLGFWNGVASPFPTVNLAPERWSAIPELQEEYSLVLGGSAFSVTASTAKILPERLATLPGVRGEADLAGVYRGVGRALWFLYMHNPTRLAEALEAHPAYAEPLAQGLGIAITYTQLGTPDRVFRDFAALPERHWPALVSGARVALGGLCMEDTRVSGDLDQLPAPLDAVLAEARDALVTLPPGPGWARAFEDVNVTCSARWEGLRPPATRAS